MTCLRYNIVFPCMMMSTLTVLVFCLPPDSGEKIALGVTVLLAFSVFMLAIAEKMPETSESIPLIGEMRKLPERKQGRLIISNVSFLLTTHLSFKQEQTLFKDLRH